MNLNLYKFDWSNTVQRIINDALNPLFSNMMNDKDKIMMFCHELIAEIKIK